MIIEINFRAARNVTSATIIAMTEIMDATITTRVNPSVTLMQIRASAIKVSKAVQKIKNCDNAPSVGIFENCEQSEDKPDIIDANSGAS